MTKYAVSASGSQKPTHVLAHKVLPRISAAIEQSASSEEPIIKKTRPKRVLRYENHIKNYSMLIEKIFWQIIKKNLNFCFNSSGNLINCVILISAKSKIH